MKSKNNNPIFEHYIPKILKNIDPDHSITTNAKKQLNSALYIIAVKLSELSLRLSLINQKKTISENDVINSIKILLTGQLSSNSIKESNTSIEKFNSSTEGVRQSKTGLIFPIYTCDTILRNFGTLKMLISSKAPIILASCLEYICAEILTESIIYTKNNNKSRLTINYINLSIRQDKELNELFSSMNISFIGCGIVPYITNSIINNKASVIRKIILDQTNTHLIFVKTQFNLLVRQILREHELRITKDFLTILQYFIEQYIVILIRDSNLIAINTGSNRLSSRHINSILSLRKNSYSIIDENNLIII